MSKLQKVTITKARSMFEGRTGEVLRILDEGMVEVYVFGACCWIFATDELVPHETA